MVVIRIFFIIFAYRKQLLPEKLVILPVVIRIFFIIFAYRKQLDISIDLNIK